MGGSNGAVPTAVPCEPNKADQYEDGRMVVWPPFESGKKEKVEPPPPRSIMDPERVAEFQRQREAEREAILQREEREAKLWEKQVIILIVEKQIIKFLQLKASKIQQDALNFVMQQRNGQPYSDGRSSALNSVRVSY